MPHISALTRKDVAALASAYELERYLFEVVSRRYAVERTLGAYDFFAIVVWKANRAKTRVKRGLLAAPISPRLLMRQVAMAGTAEQEVRILLEVGGIGLPIASAILSVCYPDRFTVLDYRVWKELSDMGVVGQAYPHDEQGYVCYCRVCRALADRLGVSLRDLDRALWAKSWQEDLRALIESIPDKRDAPRDD